MPLLRSRRVLLAILALGTAIRLWAYLTPGSLWFDELQTALNATRRGWGDILAPLEYRQVAPFGFLVAEMLGVALLGANELGLRLFPFLAAVAALFLFWRVATRFLYDRGVQMAVAFFAVAPPYVWYARKAKQYAGDLFVSLALILLALRLLEGRASARRAWAAGLAGAVLILVSQPAVFLAAGMLVVLLIQKWRSREPLAPVLLVGTLWGLGCLAQVLTSLQLTPPVTRQFMTRGWSEAFAPAPSGEPSMLLWLPKRLFRFVGFSVALMKPDTIWEVVFLSVYAGFAVFGIVHLARRRRPAAFLLFVPLAAAILASVLRVLPLSGRVMIHAAPVFVMACVAGLEMLRLRFARGIVHSFAIAMVAAPAAFLPLLILQLNRQEDARTVLEEVGERWRPGDVLFVNGSGIMAMQFYGEPLGLEPWIGGARKTDRRRILHDVDALRGHSRAWVFQIHTGRCMIAQVDSYLSAIGRPIERIDDPHGVRGMHEAVAALYDLSDRGRLARSAADTHPLLAPDDPRCQGASPVGARIRDRIRTLRSGLGF